MNDGMSDYCKDCIHSSICRYGAYCPSGHCNDKETAEDIVEQYNAIRQNLEQENMR